MMNTFAKTEVSISLSKGPQGKLCRGAWSPSHPPPALTAQGLTGSFPCFPSDPAAGQRFALSPPDFPRGARPWLRFWPCPAVGPLEPAGNRCVRPGQLRPLFTGADPAAPLARIWASAPSTNIDLQKFWKSE